MLHREVDSSVGRGIHPVRSIYSKYCNPRDPVTIIVWDGPYANSRRKKLYPEYKANRRDKAESKIEFFNIAKAVLKFAPVMTIEIEGWEADDIVGTLVDRYYKDHNITVESNDGDYWQHSEKCKLPLISKKWKGMSAEDCLLCKALVGDGKDNIKGLKGFGTGKWEHLNPENRQKIIKAIKEKDYDSFHQALSWTKAVKVNSSTFEEVCRDYHLNEWWAVPHQDIDDNLFVGKQNIQAAEIFMERFMI